VTRLSSKNQVTLPVAALARAGFRPGDEIRIEVEGDGRIALIREQDVLERFVGVVPGLTRAADLETMRDEWERS
jgi:bifunctional DNA-binding transcriptional regulator/antitoxin component of YhaV-PrlF toxin-antitoxin module